MSRKSIHTMTYLLKYSFHCTNLLAIKWFLLTEVKNNWKECAYPYHRLPNVDLVIPTWPVRRD